MSGPERLILFGDSLSDSGNAYALSGAVLKVPVPPDSAGYAGHFSNGLIQSEVAAGLLGMAPETFSRALVQLADAGAIRVTRTSLDVRDACRLRELAEGSDAATLDVPADDAQLRAFAETWDGGGNPRAGLGV